MRLGAGVFDRLRELDYPVIAFNGGEKAFQPLKYKNRRAEAYWEARIMFEAGLIDIEQEDLDLHAELMETKFKVDSTGRIQIEDKEKLSERLGHSPDRADGFVYSLQKQALLQDHSPRENEQPIEREEVFTPTNERSEPKKATAPTLEPAHDEDYTGDIMETDF
jgi:hypothetical protein